ncbi:hypothetical protein D918_01061 [Trichuris suis]|nr:hypothetical protein D918_01061 [Trichuris suis]
MKWTDICSIIKTSRVVKAEVIPTLRNTVLMMLRMFAVTSYVDFAVRFSVSDSFAVAYVVHRCGGVADDIVLPCGSIRKAAGNDVFDCYIAEQPQKSVFALEFSHVLCSSLGKGFYYQCEQFGKYVLFHPEYVTIWMTRLRSFFTLRAGRYE